MGIKIGNKRRPPSVVVISNPSQDRYGRVELINVKKWFCEERTDRFSKIGTCDR